jgi:hypothetical protein
MFENLTAVFGQLDTTPWGLLLTTPAMALNSRCANQCTGTPNPPEWWATGPTLCDFNSTEAITCYCAKDKNGGCARALRAGSFSHEPATCTLSSHYDRTNVLRFVMTVTFKNSTNTQFETRLSRGFTSAYECEDVAADECQFRQSCGAWHTVHNARKVVAGGPDATSPCDTNCDAKVEYCDSTVCWKSASDCYAGERLISSTDKPIDCDLEKPAMENCSAPNPAPIDPFIRVSTTQLSVPRKNICCSTAGVDSTPSDGTSTSAPVATSWATSVSLSATIVFCIALMQAFTMN